MQQVIALTELGEREMQSRSKCRGLRAKMSTGKPKVRLAILVAAAALALVDHSFAAISNITGLTTTMSTGTSTMMTNLSGYGASYSIFKSSYTYTLDYLGEDDAVKTVTAGSLGTYNVSSIGTAVVRRSSTGGNNDTVWYQGAGNGANHSTVTLDGPLVSGFNQAFSSNNLLLGADNVFSNKGNAVGNNTNVDRVDVLFSGGFSAGTTAFSIMDRGPSNDHDAFKIAAITALASNGTPSAYGPLISFNDGTWGTTSLIPTVQEDIVRENNALAGATLHPSDSTAQTIGGVLIQTDSLVPAGTKIYGYSLFAANVTGTGNQLVDWTNTTYFPPADSTSTGGGLDPVGTLADLYIPVAVPEPTSCVLAAMAVGTALSRRPRRKVS